MGSSFVIRPAEPGDAAAIWRFVQELAEYEKLSHVVEASAADLARDLFGPSPRVFCDLAEAEGEPVGFALWFYSYSTFKGRHGVYLEDLYVRPDQRGSGLGRALLTTLAGVADQHGYARVEWSVLDWNAPSIAFYRSLGAEPMDGWTVFRLTGPALRRAAEIG